MEIIRVSRFVLITRRKESHAMKDGIGKRKRKLHARGARGEERREPRREIGVVFIASNFGLGSPTG